MTPNRLREIIAATGRSRRELAKMLGFASENSLRQAEEGRQTLPASVLAWIEAYSRYRSRILAQNTYSEAAWLKKNPAPPLN